MNEKIKHFLSKVIDSERLCVEELCILTSLNRGNFEERVFVLDKLITAGGLTVTEIENFLNEQLSLNRDEKNILHTFISYYPRFNMSVVLNVVLRPVRDETVALLNRAGHEKQITNKDILLFLEYRETVRQNETMVGITKVQVEDARKQEQQQFPETWPTNVPNCPYYPQFPTTSPYPWQQVWYDTNPFEPDKVYCQCGHCNTAK